MACFLFAEAVTLTDHGTGTKESSSSRIVLHLPQINVVGGGEGGEGSAWHSYRLSITHNTNIGECHGVAKATSIQLVNLLQHTCVHNYIAVVYNI